MVFSFVLIVFVGVMGQWYKQINCGLLSEGNCGKVKFCVWNSTSIQVPTAGENAVITDGGRCVNDPCLSYLNDSISGSVNNLPDNCPKDNQGIGNFAVGGSTRHFCSVNARKDPPTGGEYWCARDNDGTFEDCQSDATGKSCVNRTKDIVESETFKDEICSWSVIDDDCFLDALRTENGVCNTTNNLCKEYDIEGVKICHRTDMCNSFGADCIHYPQCMVVDGRCVTDKCFSLTYDEFKEECSDNPDVCSGHQFKTAYYNYTYQLEAGSESNAVIPGYAYYYREYNVRYTYQWKCTNKNYNSNPNPFYFLKIEEGGPGDLNNATTYKKNYWWPTHSTDRCKVARDPFCGYCAEFASNDTECTGAGGQWMDLPIVPVCSDGRGLNGVRAFGAPSSLLMAGGAMLVYALVVVLFS